MFVINKLQNQDCLVLSLHFVGNVCIEICLIEYCKRISSYDHQTIYTNSLLDMSVGESKHDIL